MNNIYYIMGLAAMTLGPGREALWFAGWLDLMQLLCCALLCCVALCCCWCRLSVLYTLLFFRSRHIRSRSVLTHHNDQILFKRGQLVDGNFCVRISSSIFFMALCIYPLEHQSVPTCSPTSHTRTVENRVWSEKVVPFDWCFVVSDIFPRSEQSYNIF